MVAGLISAISIIGVFEILVMRHLTHAPALAKVVATIGLMLAIQGAVSAITGNSVPSPPQFLSPSPVKLPFGHPAFLVGSDQLWIFAIATVATAILWAMYRWTRFGLVTRALADNEEAVTLLGRSVQRTALVNWCFGGLLAGASGILLSVLVPITPTFFTLSLITSLAAALVGGMVSFWITYAAAIIIGLAQPTLVLYTPQLQSATHLSDWSEALPFVVIVIAVVVRGKSIPLRDMVSGSHLPRVTIPNHPIRSLIAVLVLGGLWFGLMPVVWIGPMTTTLIGTLVCLSLVVIVGYVGQISLGQMAFAGFSAFMTAVFASNEHIGFPLSIILGALCAVPIGVLIGLPTLRVRGMELAVITLAAGSAFYDMVLNNNNFIGDVGKSLAPASLGPIKLSGLTNQRSFGIMVLLVVVGASAGVVWVRRSTVGQSFLAVRVNERGAAASGVSVSRTKLLAFGFSSLLAGLAGSLTAYQSLLVTSDPFGYTSSVLFAGLAYLGGIGSLAGAFIGGLLANGGVVGHLLNSLWNSGWEQVISGVGILITVAQYPEGLAGLPNEMRKRLARHRQVPQKETGATATPPRISLGAAVGEGVSVEATAAKGTVA